MKKIFTLISMFFAFSMGAMAQDVIWSEDFSNYEADDVPSGGTYNYVCTDNGTNVTKVYDANLAGGESPELLIGKKNTKATNPNVLGSFAATINLNGKSGAMNISFKANNKLTVTVEGATIGDNTGTGNDYVYPLTDASGSLTITFTNNTTSNIRLDNIKLFQGAAKKPAGLSWGTSSRTVTIGADDNVFPTLTNANNLSIKYSSSDKTIATIADDGTITLLAAGSTVITAESDETDEFEAGKAQYTLKVEAAIDDNAKGQKNNPYTVAEALAGAAESKVYVKGVVTDIEEESTDHGNVTFNFGETATSTTKMKAYRVKFLEKKDYSTTGLIKVGDEVIVYGNITKYNEVNQIASGGYIYSLNGSTTGVNAVIAEQADENAPVYNLAGQRVNKNYKGVVIQNGHKFIVK
jgi:hypothetical protein